MSMPVESGQAPAPAKFAHENGTQLRLQCFVAVRDAQGRVATLKVDGIEGWCLPGESMRLNESPDEAAVRTARAWFKTPLGMQLDRVLSFPATGPEDDRWYILFVYHADAPAQLEGTPDTREMVFRAKEGVPDKWAMSHHEVWPQLF